MSYSPGDEHPDPVYDTDGFEIDGAVIRDADHLARVLPADTVIRDRDGSYWLVTGRTKVAQFGDEAELDAAESVAFPVTVIERARW